MDWRTHLFGFLLLVAASIAFQGSAFTAGTDNFGNTAIDAPADGGFSITPDDDNDLDYVTRGIYVGTSGSLHVEMKNGAEVTYDNVPVGLWPWRVRRVFEDSTATDLVGNY